ncbi:TM0106 family RecB-like putative nuclease [Donghicola sp. XS_ASV15]|uniref:TM0106 family RecB-like putative nuclease n=1 Tax=Donghicola sp. XS_ASV15 TaxID=3241295 RepID=UPI0035171009
MKRHGDTILLSATDLMRFMGCSHATRLDLDYLDRVEGLTPNAVSEDAVLLQRQGDAHEEAHLETLKQDHDVIEIDRGDLWENADQTRAALAQGPGVVFQGALAQGRWGGWSDFLERVDTPSDLGPFSYEVADTKLKRKATPKHVLQLVLYSDLLAELQGLMPEHAHVELGDGSRATLRLADYAAYARRARARLEHFLDAPTPTRPVPCSDCGLCRWSEHCAAQWEAEDSLFRVAGISRAQVAKLEAAGVTTMTALGQREDPVRRLAHATLDRLRVQARLQTARKDGPPSYELRPAEDMRGFALLPQPSEGDIFYDIEGDPHVDGGLEYLHGLWSGGRFEALWAHDHAAEARALETLLDRFRAQRDAHPMAHIYHYAPYEITALKRLTTKYGIGEDFLDLLLREGRFVDLYAVVRGGLIASEPNYSIKSMETFYDRTRDGEVKTAGGSIVAYERWLDSGEQAILDEIEDYNRIDCVSTEELRDWLLSVSPMEDVCLQMPPPVPEMPDPEREALEAMIVATDHDDAHKRMLLNLGLFHGREQKPAQWAVFDTAAREGEDLLDDLDALGLLTAIGPVEQIKRSFGRSYSYPAQETKLREGSSVTIPNFDGPPAKAIITDFDRKARRVTIKVGPGKDDLLEDRLNLGPDWPLNTSGLAAALREVIADQCGPVTHRALDDFLHRRAPRLSGVALLDISRADPVDTVREAMLALDESILPIQGPPGTGKTYVTARAILALVRQGKRVAVSSNSHEAIRNVLMGCLDALEVDDEVTLIHKAGREHGYPEDCPVGVAFSNEDPELLDADIVGGTTFLFSRPEFEGQFDVMVVDEAGQVSLANLTAMGRAARNIVLVGDPNQLPQVIQGSHPEPANLSCLEWMLGEQTTVSEDRGIFLPVSRRMHPDLCAYVSDQFYAGRLSAHDSAAARSVRAEGLPETGAWWVDVPHEGNAQIAHEEVAAIRDCIARLTAGTWQDGTKERPLRGSDIIVVAPYNAQVNALRDALPANVRVGTVDKFQGQEAPVCLVSMTASSTEETPRGMEFLFSRNRMNVAVSRAKALALVFGAPRLPDSPCDSLEQMRMVNAVAAHTALGGKA